MTPDWLDPPGSRSPDRRCADQLSDRSVISDDLTECRRYLSLADDEEGVSSGSLSDDELSIFIMSLNRQKGASDWTIHRQP